MAKPVVTSIFQALWNPSHFWQLCSIQHVKKRCNNYPQTNNQPYTLNKPISNDNSTGSCVCDYVILLIVKHILIECKYYDIIRRHISELPEHIVHIWEITSSYTISNWHSTVLSNVNKYFDLVRDNHHLCWFPLQSWKMKGINDSAAPR